MSETHAETAGSNRKPKHKRINYALAATLITSGADLQDIYAQCGAKNVNVLRVGLAKRGVTKRYANSLPTSDERTTSSAIRVASQAAEMLRDTLGERLGAAVNALGDHRVSYKDLANDGQGHAAVLKTLAEAHKTLYGGAETNITIFGAGMLEERPSEPVIDVTPEEPGK